MYKVKELIEKMKLTAMLKTNTDLAKELNVSYNTLNTWLKREKLPQEIILKFANNYNTSLDYLLLNSSTLSNQGNGLFSCAETTNMHISPSHCNDNCINTFKYYGEYEPLSIKPGDTLELNSTLFHSCGHYLLKYDNIYFIAKVIIDTYSNRATIITSNSSEYNIDISSFKSHNNGIITEIK